MEGDKHVYSREYAHYLASPTGDPSPQGIANEMVLRNKAAKEGEELAALKGQYDALDEAAIQKKCPPVR